MNKCALVCITSGVEDIETVALIDILRRGNINTIVAKVPDENHDDNDTSHLVICGRNTKLVADHHFRDIKDNNFDLIVLPGGALGARNFHVYSPLTEKLKEQKRSGKWFAANGASVVEVFGRLNILKGIDQVTFYPKLVDDFKKHIGDLKVNFNERAPVVVSQNCITSQGPGTALQFGLTLVEKVLGESTKAREIADDMMLNTQLSVA
jgi:4-methyl-5(b-hydroxyethyl)-thiazole monophosphate biosynthesis